MTDKQTEVGQAVQEVADTIEDKATTLTEFSMDKMEGFFDAAQKVLQQYGGDAVDLGLNVLRIDAFSQLLPGVLALCVLFLTLKVANPIVKFKQADADNDSIAGIVGVLGCVSLLIAGVVTFANLFNVWAWVGLFYPEIYAVHKFLL